MSDAITIILRAPLDEPLEVDGLTPDRCATLSEREIAALPVWAGRERRALGDYVDVRGGQSARLVLEGDFARLDGIGAGTAAGELRVEGSVGRGVGAGMRGGWIDVRGDAGDDAGLAMAGGALRITGSAGDRVGAAAPGAAKGMTGGEIVVFGSVEQECAARARRGLIAVGGDAGADAARAIIAGTLIVGGRTGEAAGRGSKRGSIVALGAIDVPATYRYACTFQPPYVRLVLTYLRRRYGFSPDERALSALFRRYCGDAGDPGKGEILALAAD